MPRLRSDRWGFLLFFFSSTAKGGRTLRLTTFSARAGSVSFFGRGGARKLKKKTITARYSEMWGDLCFFGSHDGWGGVPEFLGSRVSCVFLLVRVSFRRGRPVAGMTKQFPAAPRRAPPRPFFGGDCCGLLPQDGCRMRVSRASRTRKERRAR